MITRRGFIAASAALMVAPSGSAWALDETQARDFIATVVERLLSLIRADDPIEQKRLALRELLEETAALRTIARFSLGRPWRELSDAQRDEYVEIFTSYISRNYVRRFADYAGETVEVRSAVNEGPKKGVFVTSNVERLGAEPLVVEWRVVEKDGKPLIVDIYVEGVSLLLTQREEFDSLLDQNGGDVLKFMDELRQLAEA